MNRKRAPLPEALKNLRKRLNHRDESTREQAFQEALALPPEMLLWLIGSEAKRARGYERTQEITGGSCCLWVLACLATAVGQFAYHTVLELWDALLFLWIPLFISVMRKTERYPLHTMLSRAILAQNDARFVMPALLFYHHSNTGLRNDLRQTLLRLLPQLTSDDVETYTISSKAALRQQMFWRSHNFELWHDLEMLKYALQTLGRVGMADDIPTVRKVADMTPEQIAGRISPNVRADDRKELYRAILDSTTIDRKRHGSIDPENNAVAQDERYHQWCVNRAQEIHALANGSLAALLERSEQQQQATGLLRASQATDTEAAQILLRPQIEPESHTPPEQLLRPH